MFAGGSLALFKPGLHESRLTPAARTVFAALGAALLEGSLPSAPSQHESAIRDLLDRIDALVAALPPHAQAELSQLLAILASAPGRHLLAGLQQDWSLASPSDIQNSLQSMRTSSIALRQQAYHALHDIIGAAYFAEPSTWAMLGYPGPVAV